MLPLAGHIEHKREWHDSLLNELLRIYNSTGSEFTESNQNKKVLGAMMTNLNIKADASKEPMLKSFATVTRKVMNPEGMTQENL